MGEKKRRQKISGPTTPTLFQVGKPVPEELRRAVPVDGGGALVLGKSACMFLTGLPDMSDAEAGAARRSPLEVGLLPFGDALLVVVRIDGYATLDMPYDHRKPEPEQRGLPERQPHQGLLFHLIAFDTRSGILRGQRMVSVTPQFADVLAAQLNMLDAREGAGDWHYHDDIARAYARWPDPDAMLQAAMYRETGGMPFQNEKPPRTPPTDAH